MIPIKLRSQINFKLGLESEKKRRTKFTKDTTRAAKILQDAEKEKKAIANVYRTARLAIVALGGDGERQYPPLTQKDLEPKSVRTGTDPGKSKETDSWIFADGRALTSDNTSVEEWDLECEYTASITAHRIYAIFLVKSESREVVPIQG